MTINLYLFQVVAEALTPLENAMLKKTVLKSSDSLPNGENTAKVQGLEGTGKWLKPVTM